MALLISCRRSTLGNRNQILESSIVPAADAVDPPTKKSGFDFPRDVRMQSGFFSNGIQYVKNLKKESRPRPNNMYV